MTAPLPKFFSICARAVCNAFFLSDAGVGALAARSAVMGACLNVKINAAGLKDRETAEALVKEAEEIQQLAQKAEQEILAIVEGKINE